METKKEHRNYLEGFYRGLAFSLDMITCAKLEDAIEEITIQANKTKEEMDNAS